MRAAVRWPLLLLLAGACGAEAPSSDSPSVGVPPSSTTPVAQAIVELTNVERSRAGLSPLREESRLSRAARIHAEQMAGAGQLDHELPGATYPRLEDRLAAVEYEWQAIGENIAFGQSTAGEVVAGWMRSPGHRDNILNPAFLALGVGDARDGRGRTYFAQVFARPR